MKSRLNGLNSLNRFFRQAAPMELKHGLDFCYKQVTPNGVALRRVQVCDLNP